MTISLSDLRDYWKSVHDWIKGVDTLSKPSVNVDNFPPIQDVKDVDVLTELQQVKQQNIDLNAKLDGIISGSSSSHVEIQNYPTPTGYVGNATQGLSLANTEIVPTGSEFYHLDFRNLDDCTVIVNGTTNIYLYANQGFQSTFMDLAINSFVIKESGVRYSFVGKY